MTETDRLEARIAVLEGRLSRLEDIENIKRLQRAYGYYLDKGLWDDIVPLFAEDGSAEIAGRGVYIGRARVKTVLRDLIGKGEDGLPYGRLLNHMQVQGIVTVAKDGRSAQARWRAFIQYGEYGGDGHWAEGPYEMDYVKGEDAVWRISKLLWFPTFYTGFKTGWAEEARPRNPVSEEIPPDLPPTHEYETFPHYFVPPFHYENPGRG